MKINHVALGYCNRCAKATGVGFIELPGWHHGYAICEDCLRALSLEVQETTQLLLKDIERKRLAPTWEAMSNWPSMKADQKG